MGKVYGYIRTNFFGQDENSQMSTLRDMQVPEKDIYIDRQEDAVGVYLAYQKLLRKIKTDDLLYIKSLDALGEDYGEIGRQWRILTRERKADVVVLDMPLLDTRRGKTQFDTLVADIVLSMLEYAPGAEYEARRQRQRKGIADAKRRGVQFGRPELPLPENFEQIYRMWMDKKVRGERAAELCHMSRSQFYKKARERKEREQTSGR